MRPGPARWPVALLVLVVVGCGSEDASPSSSGSTAAAGPTQAASPPAPPTSTGSSPPLSTGITVITAGSEFGPMLYDASGQPIYLFTAEPGDRPACDDECADDWPPVLTRGAPRAASGVRAGLLGSTRRSDGHVQVTYAGHPLYYYAHEGKYEVLCHDVEEYGGTWLVVRPDGTPAPATL